MKQINTMDIDKKTREFIENKMAELDKYWKKCIVLYVDN